VQMSCQHVDFCRIKSELRCLLAILTGQSIHRVVLYSRHRKSVLPISVKQCGNIIRKRAYWFKATVTLSTTPSISERAKGFSMNV
jgi:hypothetical protein